MVEILMMSENVATPSLLKIKVFLNKSYDVIFSVHDVTNKILLDSAYLFKKWFCGVGALRVK